MKYEALSYAWGDSSNKCKLFIGSETLAITKNLDIALRHLRRQHQGRTLWVDAICINQGNNHEKNHQVRQMRDIYANASSVLIWLGESDDWIDKVMQSLGNQTFVASQRSEWADTSHGRSDLVPGVIHLLSKNWFTRMWTFQEFLVAKHPIFLCGQWSLPWDSFRELVMPIQSSFTGRSMTFKGRTRMLDDAVDSKPFGRIFYSFMKLNETKMLVNAERVEEDQDAWSLDALLEATTTRESSDPRDHVYALLGLVAARNMTSLQLFEADYAKSASYAYQVASKFIYESRASLDWLTYAIAQHGSARTCKPSWAIDFSQGKWDIIADQPWGLWLPWSRYMPATRDHKVENLNLLHDPDLGTLTVTGMKIGCIDALVSFPAGCRHINDNSEDIFYFLRESSLAGHRSLQSSSEAVPIILRLTRVFSDLAYKALCRRLGKDDAATKLAEGCVWRTACGGSNFIPSVEMSGQDWGEFSGLPAFEKATLVMLNDLQLSGYEEYTIPPWMGLLPELPSDLPMARVEQIAFGAIIMLALEAGDSYLFTTDSGYIGLAGSPIEQDDVLCVLLGCPFPVVLRAGDDGTYRLVAYTYTDDVPGTAFLQNNAEAEVEKFVLR